MEKTGLTIQLVEIYYAFYGFGSKWKTWIVNPNRKYNFKKGLSITIQSAKLD
jgi:hypothetical protein